jgi:tetratricopeptide (TPR) repeat protein
MALYVRRDGPLSAVARDFAYCELPGGATRLVALGEASGRDSLLRRRVAAELEREVAESPQHAQALILLANVALAESRYADARDLARRALAIDPLREGAHLRLALIALEEGSAREALREVELERALGEPSARHDVVAGQAWAMLGDVGKARAAYRRALKREPGNAQARDSLAALGGGG